MLFQVKFTAVQKVADTGHKLFKPFNLQRPSEAIYITGKLIGASTVHPSDGGSLPPDRHNGFGHGFFLDQHVAAFKVYKTAQSPAPSWWNVE